MSEDALSKLLRVSGVQGALISRADLGRPFGVATTGMDRVIFHVPLRGRAWVQAGEVATELAEGDLILVPSGAPHAITDRPDRPTQNIASYPAERRPGHLTRVHNHREPDVELLCGTFSLGAPADRWLLDPLPPALVVRSEPGTARYLQATTDLMRSTLADRGPGSALIADRLLEIVVIQVFRAWAAQKQGVDGWLAAVADPRLGPVLTAVHDRPEEPWSLERMARTAGMSRTRFCAHFRDRLQVSPGAWLLDWRMAVARRSLAAGAAIAEAAEASGYRSEAAFSRAFKRHVGASPATWRTTAARRDGARA